MAAPMADDSMDQMYKGETMDETSPPESVDQQEQEEMSKTAVVPMSVLMGDHTEPIKVGDEVVLKVKSIHGDQAMVEYSETPPGEIGHDEARGESGDEDPNAELDRLGSMY